MGPGLGMNSHPELPEYNHPQIILSMEPPLSG